jgi:pyruvate dehydrogenase E1 component alpha subunit
MAALWKLPVIFVIENNRYAMGTAVTAPRPRRISPSAASPSAFRASRSTAWTSAPSTRPPSAPWSGAGSGKGPYILEMQTYRYRGHSMSDPAKYRSRTRSRRCATEHDPIEQVRERLLTLRGRTRRSTPPSARTSFAKARSSSAES